MKPHLKWILPLAAVLIVAVGAVSAWTVGWLQFPLGNRKFPGIGKVKSAEVITRYSASQNRYRSFRLKNLSQRWTIVDVLSDLNRSANTITPDTDTPELSNGGLTEPVLRIEFNDQSSLNITYTPSSKTRNQVLISDTATGDTDSLVTSKALVRILDRNWDRTGGKMKTTIH